MPITSSHNDKLKEIRRLARRRSREDAARFVAEGEDLVAAAAAAGWEPAFLLTAAGSGLAGDEVEPALLEAVSGLGSGSRQIGVYEQRWSGAAGRVGRIGPLCVALWGVADPGNVGTILRSARAFGASSVALGPGCADPFGPKAVRASMGAIFEIALARVAEVDELPGERIALAGRAGAPLSELGLAGGELTLLLGAERTGLPADVVASCDRAAHIPIATESLNVAMAATIALYELTRGRLA
jgi:TrmH family RNA methyltransferase